VENGFSAGTLHTLFCTSTLAAGINLPARRVIIRHGSQKLAVKRAAYLQMIGRAGRAGKCDVGESFLVCDWHAESERTNAEAVAAAQALLAAPMPQLSSHLVPKGWTGATVQQRRWAHLPLLPAHCLVSCAPNGMSLQRSLSQPGHGWLVV
jgi:superfamily II DNA/RNA helicase